MNRAIISCCDGTALAVFESPSCSDPRPIHRICSYHRTYREPATVAHARVVGHGIGPTRALIVRVAPHSLAEIVERATSGRETWRYFRIGADFEISSLDSRGRPLPQNVIESFLLPSPAADFGPAAVSDEDLSLLYSVRRLPWLQEILDAQLRHWDVHDVGRYYQFSPQPVTRWDIWRCTKAAPYWALARWMGRLTLSQRGFCMRRSPQGAVSFALERLPPWSRTSHLERHPAAALLNAADKLTDAEFAFCATREPQAVFAVSCRRRLQPDRRAVLWSMLYPKLHYRFGYEQPPGLQRDMLDSITAFPTIWLDAHQGGGFAAIFSGLARHFAIRPDIASVSAMHHRMDPSGRQAFSRYIASLI